ncbi:dihydrodipicolinate synthase family protein [Nonomuraea sp. NEAU-A123]|uniref:dihydrodipicolinate synthase family protein n=1 Tax=Nonomuraea sp. NEAU-A123 TaxID=2839649 RepID=UPI001BE4900A|nr:dihydrodipicolinate synthase family protein [Nonomuraea sp. NEAU-A123]MBT2229144.1 dihydrodipicolinate synthase family protein [Nonomuraea sp. NEAU-A123]
MPENTRRRAEVLAAVPTFFDEAGELDHATAKAHFTDLARHLDGVFVCGTTGEFPALDRAERRTLAEAALAVFGPDRVVVHVGAAATRDAVALTRDAVALGARRLAALTPYYLPADTGAVLRHFAAVTAAAGPAAVYGYLFSERSGVVVEPAEFAMIAAETGLAGAKLSGLAAERFAEYRAALPPQARLWSGADTKLAEVVRHGGAGVVSGLSAAFPEPFAMLADAVADGDAAAERSAQARVDEVLAALGGTVEGIKLALSHLGRGTGTLRMPAPEIGPDERRHIARLAETASASPAPE